MYATRHRRDTVPLPHGDDSSSSERHQEGGYYGWSEPPAPCRLFLRRREGD
ncbi:hypothetical protein Hanom_Chr07g00642321 [Helianthus anomalus]